LAWRGLTNAVLFGEERDHAPNIEKRGLMGHMSWDCTVLAPAFVVLLVVAVRIHPHLIQ
jgi:hypothetical protein